MPEITVHYTENLPSTDDSYKTRRFTVELKQSVPENGDITGITQRLFMVAKANVQSQVERAKSDLAIAEQNGSNGFQQPAPAAPVASNGNGNGRKATQKQIKYLFQLGQKAGLSREQVNALPQQYFSKQDFQSLTSSEASNLINTLSAKKAA